MEDNAYNNDNFFDYWCIPLFSLFLLGNEAPFCFGLPERVGVAEKITKRLNDYHLCVVHIPVLALIAKIGRFILLVETGCGFIPRQGCVSSVKKAIDTTTEGNR